MKIKKKQARGAEDLSREAQLKNANISVMRALLKDCKAPDLYWGEVPCHDPKTRTDGHMTKLPFILPHELLQNMLGKDGPRKKKRMQSSWEN